MFILAFFLYFDIPKPLSLLDLGIYKAEAATIHKVKNNYLICSSQDSAIALFDNTGKRLQLHNDRGNGPGQLFKPSVFGVTENRIFILNNLRSFNVYDHNLNLLKETLSPIPYDKIRYSFQPRGHYEKPDSFLFFAEFSGFAYYQINKSQAGWDIVGQIPEESPDVTTINYHDGLFFMTSAYFAEETYQINVLKSLPKKKDDSAGLQQALVGNLRDFPNRAHPGLSHKTRASIMKTVKTNKGFIVEFQRPEAKDRHIFWDYFDDQGVFQKRVKKDETWLIPVTNSNEVFVVEDGEQLFFLE